jgi:hypothetical protein
MKESADIKTPNSYQYSQDDIEELERIQTQMLKIINLKENWEGVGLDAPVNILQNIKEKQQAKERKISSKEILGISPSSRISYSPLLLRQLAHGKRFQKQRKQLIPVQQALLDKYSREWEEKAGTPYPFVRLNSKEKIEFAHLAEGLSKEEMSRYIVIDSKDHKMHSEKFARKNNTGIWDPNKERKKEKSNNLDELISR